MSVRIYFDDRRRSLTITDLYFIGCIYSFGFSLAEML